MANQHKKDKHSHTIPLVQDVFGPLPRPFGGKTRDRFAKRHQIPDTMGAEIDDAESLGLPKPTIRLFYFRQPAYQTIR